MIYSSYPNLYTHTTTIPLIASSVSPIGDCLDQSFTCAIAALQLSMDSTRHTLIETSNMLVDYMS